MHITSACQKSNCSSNLQFDFSQVVGTWEVNEVLTLSQGDTVLSEEIYNYTMEINQDGSGKIVKPNNLTSNIHISIAPQLDKVSIVNVTQTNNPNVNSQLLSSENYEITEFKESQMKWEDINWIPNSSPPSFYETIISLYRN